MTPSSESGGRYTATDRQEVGRQGRQAGGAAGGQAGRQAGSSLRARGLSMYMRAGSPFGPWELGPVGPFKSSLF